MNRLFAFVTAFFLVCSCSAQHKVKAMASFYDRYAATGNVTQLSIPRFLLRMGADDPELRQALKYMHSLKIFILEQGANEPQHLHQDLDKALRNDGFEAVLEIREQKERVGIYIIEEADMVRHVLLAVEDEGELVLLQARTHFSVDQLSRFLSDVCPGKGKKGLNSLYSFNK